jgi:hypothetical protein
MMDKDKAIKKLADKMARKCRECGLINSTYCELCIIQYFVELMVEEVEEIGS